MHLKIKTTALSAILTYVGRGAGGGATSKAFGLAISRSVAGSNPARGNAA